VNQSTWARACWIGRRWNTPFIVNTSTTLHTLLNQVVICSLSIARGIRLAIAVCGLGYIMPNSANWSNELSSKQAQLRPLSLTVRTEVSYQHMTTSSVVAILRYEFDSHRRQFFFVVFCGFLCSVVLHIGIFCLLFRSGEKGKLFCVVWLLLTWASSLPMSLRLYWILGKVQVNSIYCGKMR
jgi:hypothetical protein